MIEQKKQKSLSEVFKELERDKNKQVQIYNTNEKIRMESSFIFHVKHRTKKDNFILILIILILLSTVSLFSKNYIFAVTVENEPKKIIGKFEENNNPKDIYAIFSENMSNTYQKEIVDIEEEISFETQYIYNKDKPEGENQLLQEGIIGKKLVTYVKSYENNSVVEQNSIGERILQKEQNEIIEVGTSNVLKQYNIHIGDNLYVATDIELRKSTSSESDSWVKIPKYYDVKALEVINEAWIKVSYNDQYTGYILTDYLTSETLTSGIVELCKNTKILNKVNFDMALNEISGLNLDDYKKILSNQPLDTKNVFKENYKAFYDAERKYQINGIFLTAIAIHESGWGKSTIANDKHNLFGFGAYDASPYESAITFETYSDGIDTVAAWLTSNYLNPAGTVLKTGSVASGKFYNGSTVSGVNIKYASDTEWCSKVFKTMQNLYEGL